MSTVFISYSSKDASEARRLSRELTRQGIRTWIDEYEILPGDSIIQKISDGIRQSDFLVVILSKNSNKSNWVKYEIEQAFSDNKEASSIRIIPVRIDNSPMSENLKDIRFIDLTLNYDAGIDELTKFLIQDKKKVSVPRVSDILNPSKFAEQIGEEQKKYKGSGYLVTTILGIVTLIITAIAAIPAFYSAFGENAKVYYAVSSDRILIPEEIDNFEIRKLLNEKNIPDATVRIDVINTGNAAAKAIQAGINIQGIVKYSKSIPPAKPEPVWVNINVESTSDSINSFIKFSFKELVPTKVVSAIIGYQTIKIKTAELIDVVYDGLPAERVKSIEEAPIWTVWSQFEKPLSVFLSGIGITILIGIVIVIRSNPKLRDATLLLLKELNPTISHFTDIIVKLLRF